jgi:hypothetical protein
MVRLCELPEQPGMIRKNTGKTRLPQEEIGQRRIKAAQSQTKGAMPLILYFNAIAALVPEEDSF